MIYVECWHFYLRQTRVVGKYEIGGDSHIAEDFDRSSCLKFVEMTKEDFFAASDTLYILHPVFIRHWFFESEVHALSAWEIGVQSFAE